MQNPSGLHASIGILAGVVQLAYLAVAFGVGGLLLARGRRSGEWAQWLIGLHLLLSMGVGFLLTCFGTVVVEYRVALPTNALAVVFTLGYAATSAGLMITLHFTRQVFRPGSGLALAFAAASGAAIWIGWLGYVLSGGVAHGRFEGTWYWVMTIGMLACNLWVAFEPLRYFALLQRRVRVGMGEPAVADRMRLWGVGSVARSILVVAGPLATRYVNTLADSEAARLAAGAAVLAVASLLGLVTSGTYWLAFQPPRAYLRWVERRAARRHA